MSKKHSAKDISREKMGRYYHHETLLRKHHEQMKWCHVKYAPASGRDGGSPDKQKREERNSWMSFTSHQLQSNQRLLSTSSQCLPLKSVPEHLSACL